MKHFGLRAIVVHFILLSCGAFDNVKEETMSVNANLTRPIWKQFEPENLMGYFSSSEMLQMYHLATTDKLYEKGGLNHALSFRLTALAFKSVDNPSSQVVLSYQPSNMTISLIPVISENGLNVTWLHMGGKVVYTEEIDSDYWYSESYMASTTGSLFSSCVVQSNLFQISNPRYQPFSVYNKESIQEIYPASSSEEFVWQLIKLVNSRGVKITPAILPKKIEIMIYSNNYPSIVNIESEGSSRLDVVSYYRALGLCLQTRKYSYITSLMDFAKYFDCLDDVAYIGLGQSDYLKFNLSSSLMDHVISPGTLPEMKNFKQAISWFDVILIIGIWLLLACGFQRALEKAGLIRHLKKKKLKRASVEDDLAHKHSIEMVEDQTTQKMSEKNEFLLDDEVCKGANVSLVVFNSEDLSFWDESAAEIFPGSDDEIIKM